MTTETHTYDADPSEADESADYEDEVCQPKALVVAQPNAIVVSDPNAGDRLILVCADDLEMEAIEWFWHERFARGKLNLIGGLPDVGKGNIAAFLVAAATANVPLPLGEGHVPQGNVIWFNAEDGKKDTIKPRLRAAGADLRKVQLVDSAEVGGNKQTFNLLTDLPLLHKAIEEVGDVVLVVIDPIGSYLGVGKVNAAKGTDVRAVLDPVTQLAEELHVTILGLVHFNKKDDVKNALLRVSDSIAFVAAPRSVYAAMPDPEDPASMLFLKVKNNVARRNISGLRYTFAVSTVGFDERLQKDIKASRVVWLAHVDLTANDVLAAAGGEKYSAKKEAEEFLRNLLVNGPLPFDDVVEVGKQEGHSKRTIDRAKKTLGIRSRKTAAGAWMWELSTNETK
jgi:hypothetical protein